MSVRFANEIRCLWFANAILSHE